MIVLWMLLLSASFVTVRLLVGPPRGDTAPGAPAYRRATVTSRRGVDERHVSRSQSSTERARRALLDMRESVAHPGAAAASRVPVPGALTEIASASLADPNIRVGEWRVKEAFRALVVRAVSSCAPSLVPDAETVLRFEGRLLSTPTEARLLSARFAAVAQGAPLGDQALSCIVAQTGAELSVRAQGPETFGSFDGPINLLAEVTPARR